MKKLRNISFMLIIIPVVVLFFLSQQAESTTILVDGVSEWKNPNLHVGDTTIFKHKYLYSLYIFKNKNAFNICNFTEATLLTKPNSSSYTWHPSRPGIFYFTFNNGRSFNTCKTSQRLSIKVSAVSSTPLAIPSPEKPPIMAVSPTPASRGGVSSSPAYPWPFRPREAASSSPTPAPIPVTVPDKGGGIPFINSNPAVPLPTGEVDSSIIRPMPTSGHVNQVEAGLLATQLLVVLSSAIFLML